MQQRCTGENLPLVGRSVKFRQALSTGYEEKVEVKDEVDFGWEFNESSTKTLRPYAVLKDQFENMKADLVNNR